MRLKATMGKLELIIWFCKQKKLKLGDFRKKFTFLKYNYGEKKSGLKIGGKKRKIDNLPIKELEKRFYDILSSQITISNVFSKMIIEI